MRSKEEQLEMANRFVKGVAASLKKDPFASFTTAFHYATTDSEELRTELEKVLKIS